MAKNLLVYKDFNSFAIISFLFTGIGFFLMISIIFIVDYDNIIKTLHEQHFFNKLINIISEYFKNANLKKNNVLETIGISSLGLIIAYTFGVLMYILGIVFISLPANFIFILKSNHTNPNIDKALKLSSNKEELCKLNINSKMIYIYLLIRDSETAMAKEMKLLFDMLMFGRSVLTSVVLTFIIYSFIINSHYLLALSIFIISIFIYAGILFYIDRILYLATLAKTDKLFNELIDEANNLPTSPIPTTKKSQKPKNRDTSNLTVNSENSRKPFAYVTLVGKHFQ